MKLYRAQFQGPCGLVGIDQLFFVALPLGSPLETLLKIPSLSAATHSFLPCPGSDLRRRVANILLRLRP